MRARALLNYAISVLAIVAFAYINAFFPHMFFTLFILYLLVTMGVMMLITGRAVSKAVKDYEYVEKGKILVRVSREVVRKLRERDKVALTSELKSQWGIMALYFAPFIAFAVIVALPALRDVFSFIASLIVTEELERRFVSFLLLYFTFFAVSVTTTLVARYYASKRGGMLSIPLSYTVTDRGVIMEGGQSIRFPLKKSQVKCNSRRRFVEIEVVGPQQTVSRVRLYYPKPHELYRLITSKGLEAEER